MSDPAKPQPPVSSGVFSSLPRQRTRRQQLVRGSGIGLLVIAGAVWLLFPSGPGPGDHAPMPVCASADDTSLRADVDGDGDLDEIRDPGRDGKASVVFRHGDERWKVSVDQARSVWQKAAGALRSHMETRGTFGDFDGNGYVDLALFYSQQDEGDTPRSYMPVHEVRYGPLARDLSSERTGTIRIRSTSFVYGVWATDQDGDGRAELQVFQSRGDGAVSQYIGRQDGGGVTVSDEEISFYGVPGWPHLELGWRDFGTCAD